MAQFIIEIIISCFAVYGFLIMLYDIKNWCIVSAKKKREKKNQK